MNHYDFIDETTLLMRLPISRRTLFDYRKRGLIPYIKGSRRVIYHWPSVEKALQDAQKKDAK